MSLIIYLRSWANRLTFMNNCSLLFKNTFASLHPYPHHPLYKEMRKPRSLETKQLPRGQELVRIQARTQQGRWQYWWRLQTRKVNTAEPIVNYFWLISKLDFLSWKMCYSWTHSLDWLLTKQNFPSFAFFICEIKIIILTSQDLWVSRKLKNILYTKKCDTHLL